MDLIFPLAQVLEKGNDSHGRAAVGQSDIRQFYDHIRPLKVHRWCQKQSVDPALCFAFVRLHTCTHLSIGIGDAAFQVNRRCIGVLIGTRSAAVAGRIPILDVAKLRLDKWKHLAYKTPVRTYALACFVDNLFSSGSTITEAATILDDAGLFLSQRWGLQIGV